MKTLSILTALALGLAGAAQADWRSERTTTANGVTSNALTTVTRNGNTSVRSTTVERSNGTGYTRDAVHTWDPETRSWTRSVTGATANGNTWTNNRVGTCSGSTCSSQSTFQNSNGRTIEGSSETTFRKGEARQTWSWRSNNGRGAEGQRVWRRVR
ncbi:MAG: hypothetical protein AAGF30_03875 [Pseudomonadota bacterium]